MNKDFGCQMDGVQNETSMVVCYCITVALHEKFGVGGSRFEKVASCIEQIESENTELLMSKGKKAADDARAAWLKGSDLNEFRVPQYYAPKSRKERQLLIAKNTAATISWQVYAQACIKTLGFGTERLKRLYKESMANLKEFYDICNEDSYAAKRDPELAKANKTMAMERLRVASENALKCDLRIVDGEDEVVKQFQDFEKEFKERKTKEIKRRVADTNASKIFNTQSMGAKSPSEISKIFEQCFTDTISVGANIRKF